MARQGQPEWFEQLPCSVMVCDRKFTILYMNEKAARDHAEDGGRALVGKDLMDCHPSEARDKLREVLASGRPNVYTIEKKRRRKLVYQCQWKKGRQVAGLVQLVVELPANMPNHMRS